MKMKVIAAMAVLALMFAGVGAIFTAPADDATEAAIDTEKGTITLTYDGIVLPMDVSALIGSYDGATYKYAIDPDVELTFANMSDYELIKPFIKAGFVTIPVETFAGFGDAQDEYINAIVAFCDVTYTAQAGFAGDCETSIVFATPKAASAASAQAVADAIAELTAEKDAVIAEKEALVAEKVALIEEKDAKIAELTAAISEDDSAAKIAELTAAVADKDAKIADLTKTIEDKDKTIADLTEKVKNLDVKEKPLWETGLGKCMIIIVAFLVLLVVWFLYKDGKFAKILKFKKGEPKA